MFYLFKVDRLFRSFKDWKLADIIIYLQNLTAAVSHKTDHNSYSFSKLFFTADTKCEEILYEAEFIKSCIRHL